MPMPAPTPSTPPGQAEKVELVFGGFPDGTRREVLVDWGVALFTSKHIRVLEVYAPYRRGNILFAKFHSNGAMWKAWEALRVQELTYVTQAGGQGNR
eukprot:9247345-Karenia_brevis.AAC.1